MERACTGLSKVKGATSLLLKGEEGVEKFPVERE
jgi:hypothetical protein